MKKDYAPNYKKLLMVLILCVSTSFTWIASQNTLSTDSLKISVKEMGEVAKYVKFKEKADSLINRFSSEITIKDSLLVLKENKIFEYKNFIVPSLETKIIVSDTINKNRNTLWAIKEENLKADVKSAKRSGWQKLGVGVLLGLLIGIFAGN